MASDPVPQPAEILLVMGHPDEVRRTLAALRGAKIRNPVRAASDGVTALAALRGAGGPAAPCPDLVLLDGELAERERREVLADLGREARARAIPVVLLVDATADPAPAPRAWLPVCCALAKPVDPARFVAALAATDGFGISIVAGQ